MSAAGRTPGSARFQPYYKLQRWDERSMAWVDEQRAYPTPTAALEALLDDDHHGSVWRIMRVHEGGREPLPASEWPQATTAAGRGLRERAQQGLPPRVTDPAVVERVGRMARHALHDEQHQDGRGDHG